MESNEDYLSRALGQFGSKRTAKVAKPKETVSEWSEQLSFCKWLKKEYPDILFRSDIQSAGQKSPQMQNIKQIIDPYSGWPDIVIYSLNLMIEMKRVDAKLSGEHWRNQSEMHNKLCKLKWNIHVAFGAEQAKEIFLKYVNK